MEIGRIAFGPDRYHRAPVIGKTWVPPQQKYRVDDGVAYAEPVHVAPPAYLRGARERPVAANDNIPAVARYSWLKGLPGYSYLGTVYTKYEEGLERAAVIACLAAARLMRDGIVVYSPIAHSHTVAEVGGMDPLDWPLWKHQNQPLVDRASSLIVLTMKGWEESVGLSHEVASFVSDGRPVLYVSPAELGVVE